ncbi:ABC transporter permease [Georgenia sunbinii]|uniref:ABC transporter permease n=1 Tax=Georgenia sunbinii TaxID=3117728 RepID=UPI002F25F857
MTATATRTARSAPVVTREPGNDSTKPAPHRRRRLPALSLVLAWAVVVTVLLWAFLPGLFAPFDAYSGAGGALQEPGAGHLFGTDATGRDLFSRVVHGASESLSGALVAVTVGLAAGTVLGVLAGSLGGFAEDAIMRFVDILLSIPGLLLALTVVILLGPGTVNAALAVGIGSVATFARLVRSEVVQVRGSEYVEAAYGSGGRFLSVLWRHVLPNSLRPVVALAALQFGVAILALSTLGFLGYGVTPPDPEWGMIISQGRDLLGAAWWVTTLPGAVIVLVVLSANRISRAVGSER